MRTNPEVASNAEAISNFMEMQPSANRTRQAPPASEAIRQWTAEIQIELVSAVRDQASAWHRGTRGGGEEAEASRSPSPVGSGSFCGRIAVDETRAIQTTAGTIKKAGRSASAGTSRWEPP
jgi:hypothetical protein